MPEPTYTASQIRKLIEAYKNSIEKTAREIRTEPHLARMALITLDGFGTFITKVDDGRSGKQ